MEGVDGMDALRAVMTLNSSRDCSGPRILIVRMSAIGDVIHGIPVLCALREAIPNAFIGWLAEGHMGDLLEGHPALDQLIRVPRRFWKSPREVWRMRRRLRELRFDTTIDLQCLTKSAVAAWLSGARRRIGKAGEDGRELSRWFNNELVEAGGTHVIEHYLNMLRPLGVEHAVSKPSPPGRGQGEGPSPGGRGSDLKSLLAPAVRFDLQESDADARVAEKFLHERGLAGRRFALLNPGAGWPSKMWPTVRYGAVARYLGQNHGMPSVALWGVVSERPLAERIFETSARNAHMAPPTTMCELAALCRRAALFVGSDTGPMHLAVAVGTPAISLHGPSRAEWCGAYGPQNIRLQVRYEDGSSMERRKADDSAMQEITIKMVTAACDQLLSKQATRQAG
jgi:heptosyltransferase-1